MEELLTDLHYNPKTGYSSKDKLYRRAKELDDNITLKIIKEFSDRQPTAQITKQTKRQKIFSTILSPSIKNNYQIDIFVLPNPTLNKDFKYLLTCIDVYSRYAFVKSNINHYNYKQCLTSTILTEQRQLATFNTLRTKDHKIGVYALTKTSLSCFDDKRYLLDDGIESLSFGHYKISSN